MTQDRAAIIAAEAYAYRLMNEVFHGKGSGFPNIGNATAIVMEAQAAAREEGRRAGIKEEQARGGKAMDIIHRAAALLARDHYRALADKEPT